MEKRGLRDQIVLATKYTSGYRTYNKSEIQANFVGNNTKSMRLSVNASLKKLRTDYIDLVRFLLSAHLHLKQGRLIDKNDSCMFIGGTLQVPLRK